MDKKIADMAKSLAGELERAECCETFRRYNKLVGGDPALLKRIAEFKKAQTDFYYREASDNRPSLEEEKRLGKMYAELMINECASNYLESEAAVLKLFNEVLDMISSACEVELEF